MHAVGGRLLDQLTKQLALGDVNLQGRTVAGRNGGADFHARDLALFINGEERVVFALGADGLRAVGIEHGHVRALFHVELERVGVIHIIDRVAVGQHDVFLTGEAQIGAVGFERVQQTGINAHVLAGQERRQHHKTLLAVQIPLAAGTDVIHQRRIILLGNHADVLDAAVHHRGKLEIDHAVTARDRKGGNRAQAGQLAEVNIVFTGKNQTHDVFHCGCPPYCCAPAST